MNVPKMFTKTCIDLNFNVGSNNHPATVINITLPRSPIKYRIK